MAILSFWTQSIVRLRPGTKMERGSEVPDWNNPKSLTIAECSVQPASSSLTQDGRVAGVTDGLTVYAPANADFNAGWESGGCYRWPDGIRPGKRRC